MMSDYMCSNYVAKQILTGIAPYKFENRLGIAQKVNGKLYIVQINGKQATPLLAKIVFLFQIPMF